MPFCTARILKFKAKAIGEFPARKLRFAHYLQAKFPSSFLRTNSATLISQKHGMRLPARQLL
jgi:hypothetical protein